MTKLSDTYDQLHPGAERGAAQVLSGALTTARAHRRRRRATAALAGSAGLVAVALAAWPSDERPDEERIDVGGTPSSSPSTTTTSPATTTSTEPPAPGVIAPEDAGHDLLLFGDDGIAWVTAGEREVVWNEAVVAAHSDGAGGVVFEDNVGVFGTIRWLPEGATVPVDLVADSEMANLHGVVVGADSTEVLFTRTNEPAFELDRGFIEREEHLFARDLVTGEERDLGITGGTESGLDAVATSDLGLLVSTCHLQCRVHVLGGPNDEVEVRRAEFVGGLDVEGSLLAVVREDETHLEYPQIAGELVVEVIDGPTVAQIPLPSQLTVYFRVDLSVDGRSALVWGVDFSTGIRGLTGAYLVEGIGSAAPTVRQLAGAGGARFG